MSISDIYKLDWSDTWATTQALLHLMTDLNNTEEGCNSFEVEVIKLAQTYQALEKEISNSEQQTKLLLARRIRG